MSLVATLLHQIFELWVLVEARLTGLRQIAGSQKPLEAGLVELIDRIPTPAILLIEDLDRRLWEV